MCCHSPRTQPFHTIPLIIYHTQAELKKIKPEVAGASDRHHEQITSQLRKIQEDLKALKRDGRECSTCIIG